MITGLDELQTIVAEAFLNGNAEIAGICMYTVVMALVFGIFGRKSLITPFALMLPITFVFTSLGILSEGLTILLIIVSVVGLSMAVRDRT